MNAHASSGVKIIKASNQDYSYLFQRGKKSNPSALRVPLGARNQGVDCSRPPHSDTSHSAQNASSDETLLSETGGGPALPPTPIY